jgi:hypothetical protein
MIDMFARAAPLLETKTAPFVLVALQELGRMNGLLFEIRRSLLELRKVRVWAALLLLLLLLLVVRGLN